MTNRKDYENAITNEVAEWPEVAHRFEEATGRGHPRVVLTFGDKEGMLPIPSTPSDSRFGVHRKIGDLRRKLRELGATRPKPEPVGELEDDVYRKPNGGAEARELANLTKPGESVTPGQSVADKLVAAGLVPVAVRDDAQDDDEQRRRDELAELVDSIVDGVYFGLPAEAYHAVPRLSTSALQQIDCSPAEFWKDSWLDPNPTVLTEEQEKKKSLARVVGSAYHVARLEPEQFEALYIREVDKRDYPRKGLLTSDTAVKAALKAAGLTQAIGTETLLERAERLVEAGYDGTIMAIEEAEWQKRVCGRISLSPIVYDEIVIDMQRIHGSGSIAAKMTGGAAEVSIFWTDEHGLKMKARVDYLTAAHWVDFKTFANPRRKKVAQVISDAYRYDRYYMQAVVYRDAIEQVRVGGLQIIGDATDEQRAMVAAIQIRPHELDCHYIFQQKGGVPNLLSRRIKFWEIPLGTEANHAIAENDDQVDAVERTARRRTGLFRRGLADVERCKQEFHLYAQVYAPGDPWRPIEPEGTFDDLDFNDKWLEGMYS